MCREPVTGRYIFLKLIQVRQSRHNFQVWFKVPLMLSFHKYHLFSPDALSDLRRSALTMSQCLPVTHRHVSSSQPHVSRAVTLPVTDAGTQSAPQSQSGIMSWQHMPTHCIVCTWPGTKWTTQYYPSLRQKSHREPHFSTHWWDRLTLQHTEGEVWVWQPATIISSCHYLPGHSQLCSRRQMHKHCIWGKHARACTQT